MDDAAKDAQIALNVIESSPSVAMRVQWKTGGWKVLFVTRNISAFGYTREEFLSGAVSWADWVYAEDWAPLCGKLDEFAEKRVDQYTVYYRVARRGGQEVWLAGAHAATRGARGEILYLDCMLTDHTQAMEAQQKLRSAAQQASAALLRGGGEAVCEMAYRDPLTGLASRYRFDSHMEKALRKARLARRYGYVLFIDLDDFKVINEGYGHDYGDALLVAAADYLRENFGDKGTIFRFGGDEYTILVNHEHADQMRAIVDKLLQRARRPWLVMDHEFYCTVSIGVVRFPDGEAADVIRHADVALYQAKNRGKNSYVLDNHGMGNDSMHRVETEHRMRDAIENHFAGFCVHYQPIVDIMGGVVGAEALVRWVDAAGNLMPPAKFIPLAEYLGLVVPLGEFVLREAAEQCRRINEKYPDFTMSVNVSIRQFQQHDFLARAEQVLRAAGVRLENIVLEMTEGMLVQNMAHMRMMAEQLRGFGVRIAMDDFGTGYSSLNNMRQLPLDVIKIDRSFIKDVMKDDYAKNFVRLIADLCHSMGREVCVEGVETAAQYSYCAACGADKIQGFYFYRPMSAEDLEQELLGGGE